MASEVTLPALGESVTEGTVTRWLKQVGDTIAVDEPLLEVSTDKVDTEIPSPVGGVLLEIRANEDDTVEVGAVLAIIGEEGEGGSEAAAPAEEESAPTEEEPTEDPAPADEPAEEESAPSEEPAQPAASGGSSSGTSVTLPALGESVTEGTVTRWLKQVGDEVAVDEPLLEVSTDKVDTEIPSPVAGTLLEVKVAEDETVEVGAELAIIGDKGAAPAEKKPEPEPEPEKKAEPEKKPEPEPEPEKKPEPEPEKAEAPEAPAEKAPEAPSNQVSDTGYVTPLVRKLANQHGVDLAAVTGTGVGGRVRKQDVLDAAKAKETAPAAPAAASAPAAEKAAPVTPSAARQDREDDPPAQGDRQAHGRLAADLGPADPGRGGRCHQHRPPPRPGEGRVPRS